VRHEGKIRQEHKAKIHSVTKTKTPNQLAGKPKLRDNAWQGHHHKKKNQRRGGGETGKKKTRRRFGTKFKSDKKKTRKGRVTLLIKGGQVC